MKAIVVTHQTCFNKDSEVTIEQIKNNTAQNGWYNVTQKGYTIVRKDLKDFEIIKPKK